MGLLENKVSTEDLNSVNMSTYHGDTDSEFGEEIFEGNDFGNLDDLFGGSDSGSGDSLDDLFGSSSGSGSTGFGGASLGNTGFGGTGFGGTGFGNTGLGGTGFGNTGFGNTGFGNTGLGTQEKKPDILDKMFDVCTEGGQGALNILINIFKSIRERNCDDIGYLSSNNIKAGIAIVITGIICLLFAGMAGKVIAIAGMIISSLGLIGLGTTALVLSNRDDTQVFKNESDVIDRVGEINSSDNHINDIEEISDDIWDSLFEDNMDSTNNNDFWNTNTVNNDVHEEEEENRNNNIVKKIDYNKQLDKMKENKYIDRKVLVRAICDLLPTNTPDFNKKTIIEERSSDWDNLNAICVKALANIANCSISEVGSSIVSANETLYAYEVKLKRINKVKQADVLAREIEVYVRDKDNKDAAVSVTIEGDYYNIIISKGVSTVITLGDILRVSSNKKFFNDTDNVLPMVTGVTELGEVILDDAKIFDTMMIAGKPRSGKSWYVLSIIMSLLMFNTPEDVQMIIIDPKESNLFKTVALLPHVCGLHNNKNILKILDDVIEIEAPRRKKLLSDNKCDDIWSIRKKGIMLPVLYVVIDEYITVLNDLDKDDQKELNNKLQVLISQLPSLGIRLIFVPHRATGIVNKTNRTMLQFTAAVRADIEDVKDTLGIAKWDRVLTKQGDVAVKSSASQEALFVRGIAVTTDDAENVELIEVIAKLFYKMGVNIPDMSAMRIACNRDEYEVQKTLGESNTKKIQYDANKIIKELNDID